MGENFCQPPLLPSRPEFEFAVLDAPSLELRASELLAMLRSSDWPVWPKRCDPFVAVLFSDDRFCDDLFSDALFSEDRFAAVVVPWVEKKCWFWATFRVVDAAAARPLAEKLSRPGLTGGLPVLNRAFWNCECVIAEAFMWPVPKSLPETVVPPRKFASCIARFTFEKREPECSAANPPRL
jgi:hypothetical protein